MITNSADHIHALLLNVACELNCLGLIFGNYTLLVFSLVKFCLWISYPSNSFLEQLINTRGNFIYTVTLNAFKKQIVYLIFL